MHGPPLLRRCLRHLHAIPLALACLAASLAPAAANILAQVDQGRQRMRVYVHGVLAYDWPVSTARRGFVTPNGRYRVGRMEPMWRSRRYGGAPMPYALFFRGGYAIHGTDAAAQLGRRASHGCIRLGLAQARTLFHLARMYGGAQVQIRN